MSLKKYLKLLQDSNLTGMSTFRLNQIEQGGRNLSVKELFQFMNTYGVDANTVLDISKNLDEVDSIAVRLAVWPEKQRTYFISTFSVMWEG